eukprot:scaffold197937_cov37-Tisochrysis_lutea.AAC.2
MKSPFASLESVEVDVSSCGCRNAMVLKAMLSTAGLLQAPSCASIVCGVLGAFPGPTCTQSSGCDNRANFPSRLMTQTCSTAFLPASSTMLRVFPSPRPAA